MEKELGLGNIFKLTDNEAMANSGEANTMQSEMRSIIDECCEEWSSNMRREAKDIVGQATSALTDLICRKLEGMKIKIRDSSQQKDIGHNQAISDILNLFKPEVKAESPIDYDAMSETGGRYPKSESEPKCKECRGTGVEINKNRTCPVCHGTGKSESEVE